MSKYNIYRNVKILGSVIKTDQRINDSASTSVLSIKASAYDLSLRNRELLDRYASVYNISRDLKDYTFIPVPIFITNVPNKNGVAFLDSELDKFFDDIGKKAYETWIGKPCFVEHHDEDKTASIGMIFDAVMRPLSGYSIPLRQCWVLWGLDRTKNLDMTKKIEESEHNYFSMGARANCFKCSICGAEFKNKPTCQHLRQWPWMSDYNGVVACANAVDIVGEEVSYVEDPAWVSAESTKKLELK